MARDRVRGKIPMVNWPGRCYDGGHERHRIIAYRD
jgi:hypothetical protein